MDNAKHIGDKSEEGGGREAVLNSLRGYVMELGAQADIQVRRKHEVEVRWLEDVRQFHGRYSPKVMAEFSGTSKSRLFANITRSRTNTWAARLLDMLFPTDEKNWAVYPTPVPDMAFPPAETAMRGVAPDEYGASSPEAEAMAVRGEAIKRAALMEAEIDDQLRECRFNAHAHMAIEDACKLGTGIIKGPILLRSGRHKWENASETGEWNLAKLSDPTPCFERVDPWSVFPDMSARNPDDAEFWYERHLMNRKELQELARAPGFLGSEISSLLRNEPTEAMPEYLASVREVTGAVTSEVDNRYVVWEYRGPIERSRLMEMCSCHKDDIVREIVEEDPLDVLQGVVWFCQGYILKFGLHVLDSGESIYSVFNLEKDETSIFGFGVPYLLRDAQAALSASYRMMHDNAGLSVGPQVVVNRSIVTPADGDWSLTGRKLWYREASALNNTPPFETFNVPSGQAELANMITLARDFADEETQLSAVARGEPGARTSGGPAANTVGGLSMLMNSVNVVFRRVVRNYDNDITTPCIRRMYNWNMQFNIKPEIKGDYNVDARGSSVLLVREIQSQNLMAIALQLAPHPIFGKYTNSYKLFRRLIQANMVPADEIVKTEEEVAADEAAALQAQQGAGAQRTPEDIKASIAAGKMSADLEIAKLESETRIQIAELERDTAMLRTAAQMNMSLDQINAELMRTRSSERTFAAELAVKDQTGQGI